MREAATIWIMSGLLAGIVWGAPDATQSARVETVRATPDGKRVSVDAVATGLPEGDPVEFLLIGANSGHDYESLAVARCRPGDVHRALQTAGFEPGRPADPADLALWPRGESVRIEFEWADVDGSRRTIEARELIRSTRTEGVIPDRVWLFTGSEWIEPATGDAPRVYAADLYSPHAIASLYNTSLTVLDRAVQAPQSPVYGTLFPSGAVSWTNGQPLTVHFVRPPEGAQHPPLEAAMTAAPAATGAVRAVRDVRFTVTRGGQAAVERATLPEAVEVFQRWVETGARVYLDLGFDRGLSLSVIRSIALALGALEDAGGIRVEPPEPGRVYYRAFLPPPDLRDMERRPSQPWELHLEEGPEGPRASLRKIREEWTDGADGRSFEITEFPLDRPSNMVRIFEQEGRSLPVLLVFAPGEMTYGRLLEALEPAIATHPTVYVFLP